MKRIRKAAIVAASAALIITFFNSCKKGEGDPFLSLSSRKARVAGEWTISKWKEESQNTSVYSGGGPESISSSSNLYEIDESEVTLSNSSTNSNGQFSSMSSGSGKGDAETKVIFNKDGTFSMLVELSKIQMTYSENYGSSTDSYVTTEEMSIESSGTWNFLGGVEEDFRNKERIVLNKQKEIVKSRANFDGAIYSQTSTYTYANGEYSEIWQLTTLKNKEMSVSGKMSSSGVFSSSSSFGGSTETSSGTSTGKGEHEGTLIQD